MRRRWILEALGAALLLSLPYFAQLLFPGSIALYHHQHHLALRKVLCGLLLAMLEISFFVFGVIAYFHYRFKPGPRAVIGAAIAAVFLLRGTDTVISLIQQWRTSLNPEFSEGAPPSVIFTTATHFWFEWPVRLALVIAMAALAVWKPPVTRAFVRWTRTSLAAFSFCLLWIVPQLLYVAYGVKSTSHSRPPMQAAKSRQVVWILFDELSYRMIFEQPPKGMQFPNFSKLRSESVSFSDLQAPGFFTDRIIPSVIAGTKIEEIRSDADRRLLYLNSAEHRWVPYDQNDTLFGIAHSAGWNSGVAGWYNPYCRIFSSVLESCLWEAPPNFSLPVEMVGASSDQSVVLNAQVLARAFLTGASPGKEELAAPRIQVYSELMNRAKELVRDDQLDFIFIHLPVPHPPGLYDRTTHKICACGNYLDNLALADEALGELQQEIDKSKWRDKTTLIVTSDHSWRIGLWRGSDSWTPEEEEISQGKFDPRPVLLVHFPGQRQAINIPGPHPELIEHDIIASMLQSKMSTSDDLVSFLQAPHGTTLADSHKP